MDTSAVTIVPVCKEHIPSFHATLDTVAQEIHYLGGSKAPALEKLTAFVENNISKGYPQLLAVVDGQVIGWVDITPGTGEFTAHRGAVGIGLLPQWRGHGLGERLLTQCITRAFAAGMTRIALEVRVDNLRAIALYEKCGFVREGLSRNGVRVQGTYYDTVQMALLQP